MIVCVRTMSNGGGPRRRSARCLSGSPWPGLPEKAVGGWPTQNGDTVWPDKPRGTSATHGTPRRGEAIRRRQKEEWREERDWSREESRGERKKKQGSGHAVHQLERGRVRVVRPGRDGQARYAAVPVNDGRDRRSRPRIRGVGATLPRTATKGKNGAGKRRKSFRKGITGGRRQRERQEDRHGRRVPRAVGRPGRV